MRALVISPVRPFPPTCGAARRILSMSSGLSMAGWDTTILTLVNPMTLHDFRPKVFRVNDRLRVVTGHFLNSLVLREILLSDVIQFEYPYLLPVMILVKALGRQFVLDEHGVEFEFTKELKRIPREYGASRSLGFILKRMPGSTSLMLAVEKLAVRLSSMVFACSSKDAIEIQRLYNLNKDKLRVIPNCADPTFFDEVEPHKFDQPVVLFVGNFGHLPNLEGASVLVKQIMPLVRNRAGKVAVVLVGKDPPRSEISDLEDDVIYAGEVDDLRPLIMGADVAVAPIFSGSGTRQKIVDYMAMGKPIVSTAKGAEGLELQDERHFLQRDTVEDFSEAILEILEDTQKARLLGSEARQIALAKYSWNTQIQKVLAAYARVLPARHQPPLP